LTAAKGKQEKVAYYGVRVGLEENLNIYELSSVQNGKLDHDDLERGTGGIYF
jgi:hypothetical protein